MRVALLTAYMSHAAGGFSSSVPGIAKALNRLPGVEVHLVGVRDCHAPNAWRRWAERVHPHDQQGPRAFGMALGMTRTLSDLAPHIIDVQGLWMYTSLANLHHHRRCCRPYIITPRGMLDPWALANSAWKKRLATFLYEKRNIAGAACLHALNIAEAKAIRAFGFTNPIAVVPNGVDLPSPAGHPARGGRPTLLFLGRIHPKKGIAELLQAWAVVAKESVAADWRLLVAGWDDGGHLAALQRQAEKLGIADRVAFPGPLFGEQKARAFAAASAFILPSFSEGLPMAVLEAWSYRLPVLITRECNVPEGFVAGAAIEVTTEPTELAQRVRVLMTMSETQRRAMGVAGRRLVEERFTWDRVAAEMHEVYTWALGGGPPPACVMTD